MLIPATTEGDYEIELMQLLVPSQAIPQYVPYARMGGVPEPTWAVAIRGPDTTIGWVIVNDRTADVIDRTPMEPGVLHAP